MAELKDVIALEPGFDTRCTSADLCWNTTKLNKGGPFDTRGFSLRIRAVGRETKSGGSDSYSRQLCSVVQASVSKRHLARGIDPRPSPSVACSFAMRYRPPAPGVSKNLTEP